MEPSGNLIKDSDLLSQAAWGNATNKSMGLERKLKGQNICSSMEFGLRSQENCGSFRPL